MQYFYLVAYTIVGDDLTMCKIGLNPHQLIEWGKREATKHKDRDYCLYRQPITQTGEISFYKQLSPFDSKVSNVNSIEPFDWNQFDERDLTKYK